MAGMAARTATPTTQTTTAPMPAPVATPTSRLPATRSTLIPVGRPAIRLNTGTILPAPANMTGLASGGAPLLPTIQRSIERSLQVDLQMVRVHTDALAQQAAKNFSARAFTYGNHIFLGPGELASDLSLIAHEVTHVVQQQGTPAVQRSSPGQSDRYEREAQQVSAAVLRSAPITVHERTSSPQVQRLGLSDILDGLAELAANVPGFTLLTLIIGRNPINMRVVERTVVNVLRAFMGLIPGGEILFQVLNHYGVVQRIGDWVNEQTAAMGLNFQTIRDAFTRFTDSLGFRDIFSPGDVWRRAQNIFTPIITRIRDFVGNLISQAITWLKETFMQPLSNFCRQIPGYGLVTVLLGRDPFTNAAVPRTAINVVRAFAEFIPGGTEKVNQLVESRALERAYQWFIEETQARNLTWARVTGTFAQAWNSLRLEDVLHPIDTLQRMITLFRPLMSDLISFAGAALLKLLELIFEAVMGAGGARILAILKRARATFLIIINNPVGFLRNLLGAVGQGVRQFMTNILRHLRDGVIAWLTGPVAQAGIQMPAQWDLRGIIWFVMQILGLTWPRIRQKLVRLMGERPVAMLEAGFQLLQEIRERGLVQALRDRVTEFFGQLREAALGAIRSFIQRRLVQAGITQLLSLLSPVGAVIQAIIKTYTTIQFFIQRIHQILDLVESVVNSIAAIAAGSIGAAASLVERTMARTIPVILDFLARFIGLGDVGAQVQTTIRNLQARVDGMLDRAINWIRERASSLIVRIQAGVGAVLNWWRERKSFRSESGEQHMLYFEGQEVSAQLMLSSTPVRYAEFIQRVKIDGNATKQAAKAAALPIARQIDGLRTAQSVAGAPGARMQAPAIIPLLNTLATHTRVLAGETPTNPPSVITFGTLTTDGGGTQMTASILSKNHVAGTPPRDRPVIWEKANRRAGVFVRGHLLNENIGGAGRAYNLAPITIAANNDHKTKVENGIKEEVLTNKQVVKYIVTADYSKKHPNRAYQLTLRGRVGTSQEKKGDFKKLEIMDYEQNNLPVAFKTSWEILEYKSNSWVTKTKKNPEKIDNDLPDGSPY